MRDDGYCSPTDIVGEPDDIANVADADMGILLGPEPPSRRGRQSQVLGPEPPVEYAGFDRRGRQVDRGIQHESFART